MKKKKKMMKKKKILNKLNTEPRAQRGEGGKENRFSLNIKNHPFLGDFLYSKLVKSRSGDYLLSQIKLLPSALAYFIPY